MQITQVKVKNLLGIKQFDAIVTPVTMIVGPNGAGKSSIAAAVRMAMTGNIERIKHKKSLGELSHNGAKDFGSLVEFANGAKEIFGGAFKKEGVPGMPTNFSEELIEIVTGKNAVSDLKPDDLQNLLIKLAGISLTPEDVINKLAGAGFSTEKVTILKPHLKRSFEAAEAECKAKARDAKVLWEQVTCESYGAVKAESWEAINPETDIPKEIELTNLLLALSADVTKLKTQLVEANLTNASILAKQRRLEEKKAIAGKSADLVELRDVSATDLTNHDAEISRLEELASGTKAPIKYDCPCCSKPLMWSKGELLAWSHAGKEPDIEAKAQLEKMIDSRQVLTALFNRREREVTAALDAKAIVSILESELECLAVVSVSEISAEIMAKQADFMIHDKEVQQLRGNIKKSNLAAQITTLAAKHHADCADWLKLAEELAPTGLQKKLTYQAVAEINTELYHLTITGAQLVRISSDMEITLSDRPYKLLSESEQWRVSALLSLAVAHLSDIRLVVLDRFDVLDLKSRSLFLKLFSRLISDKKLDSIILAATLKEAPKLPAPFSVYWIEDGMIATPPMPQQKAA